MKFFRCLAFLAFATLAHAQQDEIPIFDLDDYYVEPRMNLSFGFRGLTGPKLSFIGAPGVVSTVRSAVEPGDPNATGIVRLYHDGYIALDLRVDGDGNPLTDGKTNNWSYRDVRQRLDTGHMAFNIYRADITDPATRNSDPGNSFGTELIVARDFGKAGSKFQWKIFAGMSINNINTSLRDSVLATITRTTDTYFMGGATVPDPVYTAPTSITDADGNVTDNSVLIGQKPDARETTTRTDNVTVSNFWKLRGTYLTFRAGPTFSYDFSDRLRLSVSAGPAAVYIGANYSVEQTFVTDTGEPIVATVEDLNDDILTGYYADANLEYLLTERAGIYMGAFFQGTGEYTQDLSAQNNAYSTKLDLSSLKGLRAGVNYRF